MVTHNSDVRFMNMALSNDQRIDGIVINILIQFHLTLHMMLIQILSYYNLNWYIQSNKLITIWTYFVPQHTLFQYELKLQSYIAILHCTDECWVNFTKVYNVLIDWDKIWFFGLSMLGHKVCSYSYYFISLDIPV